MSLQGNEVIASPPNSPQGMAIGFEGLTITQIYFACPFFLFILICNLGWR